MPRVTLDTRAAKDPSLVIDRVVDGETLLIHLPSGDYYSLNSVGTRVWEQLDGTRSAGEVADALASEFDVSLPQAQSDLLALLDELVGQDLVVVL